MKLLVVAAMLAGACAHSRPPRQERTPPPDELFVMTSEPIDGDGVGGQLSGTLRQMGTSPEDLIAGATFVLDGPPVASAISDEHGHFELNGVPPGTYGLTLYYASETRRFTGLVIAAGKRTVIDLAVFFPPDTEGPFICDGCNPPMIDTTSTQQGFTLSGAQLDWMPRAMSRQDPGALANARVPALTQDPP